MLCLPPSAVICYGQLLSIRREAWTPVLLRRKTKHLLDTFAVHQGQKVRSRGMGPPGI